MTTKKLDDDSDVAEFVVGYPICPRCMKPVETVSEGCAHYECLVPYDGPGGTMTVTKVSSVETLTVSEREAGEMFDNPACTEAGAIFERVRKERKWR